MKTNSTPNPGWGRVFWKCAFLLVGVLMPILGKSASYGLVISQLYPGGGLNGATYKKDFIELFNNSGTAVVVPASGYSVQYTGATGTAWSVSTIPAGITIQPYSYYLIQESGGTGGTQTLAADLVPGNGFDLIATGGKVALVANTTALTGSQTSPTGNASIIDFVGYGTANAAEGTSFGLSPALSNANSIARVGSGTSDTDQNNNDFLVQSVAPRNAAAPTVVTAAVSANFPTYALSGGNILRNGLTTVTERGIVFSTTRSPRLGAAGVSKATDSDGTTGNYPGILFKLTPNTLYYVTAYATNSAGTSYGSDLKFTTPTTINLYAKAGAQLEELASYGTNTDGSGPPPQSFDGGGQLYNITDGNHTIAADWTVTGTGSKVILQSEGSFVVPAAFNFTGALDLVGNATLVVQHPTPGIKFGSISATSTVEYAQTADYTVPLVTMPGYGNLTLRNGNKLLSSGTTIVRGNLLISNGNASAVLFGGASASVSLLNLGGNLTLAGPVNFSSTADDRISLSATNTSTAQVFDGGGNTLKFFKLTLPTGQAGVSLASGSSNLELGNASGGGYQLAVGTVLAIDNNTLSFRAGSKAVITGGNSTGALDLSPGSSLLFSENSTASIGTLRLTPSSTQLKDLTLDAQGGSTANNTLTLPNSLTVNGTLALANGTLAIGRAHVLTLNGPLVTGSTSQLRGDNGDLIINGTGALGALRLPSDTTGYIRNFTLNRAGQTLLLSSDLAVRAALTLTGGILDISGRKLSLNGTVATSVVGLLNSSASSSLLIGGTGPLGTVNFTSSGGVLNVLTLSRPGGTLTIQGNPLQITTPTLTSGILKLDTRVALTITGLLTTSTGAQFAGTPTSILNFTGRGEIGPLSFVDGQAQLLSLTLDRTTAASTTQTPIAQVLTSLTVNSLTLSRGSLFMQGTSRLIVLPAGGLAGGGPSSFVNTLTQAVVTNSTTAKKSLTFPLGVQGQYRPLTLTVKDKVIGTASYTARQFEGIAPTRTVPATLARVSRIRYFNVVREANGTSLLDSATIRISYVPTNDLVTTTNARLLRVAMVSPTDNTRWVDIGGAGTGADITSVLFAAGPLGDFILATDITTPQNFNPLPVELISFKAARQTDDVHLAWSTANEKNSARFEVQRSLDGQAFTTILSIAAQGNSTQATPYAAVDAQAPAGRLYYRLRQVDLDGAVAFSQVVTVAGFAPATELTLYPNPTADQLIVTLPAAADRTYRVLNALGQQLDRGPATEANPVVDVRRLPAGTYFLEISSGAGRQTRRFVKND